MMARNVQWLLDVAYPGENIVLWAHNAHVDMSHDVSLIRYGGGPAKRPMGSWLREALGTQMYVLGFEINSGRARARRTINGIVSGPVDYPLPSPAPANLVLRAAGSPMFFLDLKRATGPLRAWLHAPLDFLEFGAGWTDEVKWWPGRRLAEAFDGLIYLKHTTASRLIEGAQCSDAPCRQ